MKRFKAIIIDPPWKHGDQLPGNGRGATKHYPCLTQSEIIQACVDMGVLNPLGGLTPEIHKDCWLFLWNLHTHKADALDLAAHLGFGRRAAGELIWRKTTIDNSRIKIGMGHSVRMAHESCLIFKHGSPERLSAAIPSVFDAPRLEHSRKPDAFYEIVDAFAPGPKLELFARRQWKTWSCRGNAMAQAAE